MNLYPLLRIIADGNFHSGEELGKSLNVSRTAIWKQMKSLKDIGLDFHSVTGKGYRLLEPLDLLDKAKISSVAINNPHSTVQHPTQLSHRNDFLTLVEGMDLHLTIDSTNTQAMRKIQPTRLRFKRHLSKRERFARDMAELYPKVGDGMR